MASTFDTYLSILFISMNVYLLVSECIHVVDDERGVKMVIIS